MTSHSSPRYKLLFFPQALLCAQNATHQHKPKKCEDPNKRHDQDSIVAFKCDLRPVRSIEYFPEGEQKCWEHMCVCGNAPLHNPLCSILLVKCVSYGHELRSRSPWSSSCILDALLDNSVPFGAGTTDCTPRTAGAIAVQEWHSGWLQNESMSKFSNKNLTSTRLYSQLSSQSFGMWSTIGP
jgi:hypothetical protein